MYISWKVTNLYESMVGKLEEKISVWKGEKYLNFC
jgi:hypothetical protein